jgi:DNA-binding LytR/AlgR family response regulator
MLKMTTLNCWIIDDEPLATELLESYVSKTPFLNLTGKFSSAKSAMRAMDENIPDLIFLDIQMPFINGMEFAQMVSEKTRIIFTTAFKDYAIDGYKVNAMDYLLKPFTYADFLAAAKKALSWYETVRSANVTSANNAKNEEGIFVKSNYKVVHVLFDDILYIEGLKNYVKIYTSRESTPVITLMSMKEIENALPTRNFVRVHRSFIVKISKIESANKSRVMIAGHRIPVGETYKQNLTNLMHL